MVKKSTASRAREIKKRMREKRATIGKVCIKMCPWF